MVLLQLTWWLSGVEYAENFVFWSVGLLLFWGTLALVVHCCRHSWRFMGVSDIAEMQRPFSVKDDGTLVMHIHACQTRSLVVAAHRHPKQSKTRSTQLWEHLATTLWPLNLTPNFINYISTTLEVWFKRARPSLQFRKTHESTYIRTPHQITDSN
jgi:hypothetical protein